MQIKIRSGSQFLRLAFWSPRLPALYFTYGREPPNRPILLPSAPRIMTAPDRQYEAECIRRILAGERHLFHELIRPCERAIFFLLLSLLRNEAEAEDAAQETALKVFRNLHLFRGDSQFRTWVLSIARNEGLGRLRKLNALREDSLDAGTDEQTGDYTPAVLTSWREVPSRALERQELAALLRRAVDALPAIYRNVVLLRDIEEMETRETAAALGISETAVKVRLHRARALLQRELAPQLGAFAPRRKQLFGRRA
jgi:RNA polymerase sigma-70 factor, ECF subfamily